MGKTDSKSATKISSKKKFQQQIFDNLATSLQGLKEILGEKKFDSRIRKAAKLLSQGIKEKAPKKIKPEKKKVTKKKTETSAAAAEQ